MPWARQGVLLLNTVLTVEEARAGSHVGRGWELVTDACLAAVAGRDVPCAFILWGQPRQSQSRARSRPVGRAAQTARQRPSQPFVGESRLLRQPSVQSDQRVS
jgi:uracil DNA glycosylase